MKSLLLEEVPFRNVAFADGRRSAKNSRLQTLARASIKAEQDVIIVGAGVSCIAGRSDSKPRQICR